MKYWKVVLGVITSPGIWGKKQESLEEIFLPHNL